MIKNLIPLLIIFVCSTTYGQATGFPRSHNQLTGTGTNSHATIDTFISSKGQASGLASLDASGNVIQSVGTVSGYVKQNGTATLSGIASPYIAQTSGTGTGNSLTNTTLTNPSVTGTITTGRIYNGSGDIVLNAATSYGISLRVNNTENAFLNSVGLYVGGVGLPSYPLHVLGTSAATGNFLQLTANSYHYFGGTDYGFRDNAGTMQFKHTGGAWTDITGTQTSFAGGWQDDGLIVRTGSVTDQVVIGSTTAASNQILTVVGSTTVRDTYVGGFLAIGTANSSLIGGVPTIKLAIGDNDTGFGYVSDGIFNVVANSNTMMQVDGNTEKVTLGTTSTNTKFNVGGTVTAEGFSGNGAGLTGIGTTTAAANAVVRADANGTITANWFPGGMPVKVSATATSSLFSLSTIPDDNTLPQSSEGTEVLTVSHTPSSALNWLLIEAVANISVNSVVAVPIAAIFKNSDTDAIGANRCIFGANASNNKDTIVSVSAMPFLTGTTTPFTFKLRCGADSGTIRLNGSAQDGLTRFNGVWYTWLKVTEYKP